MKKYYECHITIQHSYDCKELLRIQDEIEDMNWKYSVIDGDPTLGDDCFCYATAHMPMRFGLEKVIEAMKKVTSSLQNKKMRVIRQKVELVVYDERIK